MKKNNYYTASLLLAIVTIGFLLSFPFSDSFWGRFASSLFGAAMIGGIADWFGITALFRKPLGIPFRTRIIPRNREKIFDSLVYMVEKELLTKEVLKEKLESLDISDILIRFLDEHGGKKDLSLLLSRLLLDFADQLDPEEIDQLIDAFISDKRCSIELSPLVIEAAEWSMSHGYDEHALSLSLHKLTELARLPQVRSVLEEMLSKLLEKLEDNSMKEKGGRKLLLRFLFTIVGMSDALPLKAAQEIQSEMLAKLADLKQPESTGRERLKKWIRRGITGLKTDAAARQAIENTGYALIRQISFGHLIKQKLHSLRKDEAYPDAGAPELEIALEGLVGRIVENFKEDDEQRKALDMYVKNLLLQLLEERHHEIGALVKGRLDTFSDDMIVDLVESKAGNDLQIIRINGSVVGAITGFILFLLTYWI